MAWHGMQGLVALGDEIAHANIQYLWDELGACDSLHDPSHHPSLVLHPLFYVEFVGTVPIFIEIQRAG